MSDTSGEVSLHRILRKNYFRFPAIKTAILKMEERERRREYYTPMSGVRLSLVLMKIYKFPKVQYTFCLPHPLYFRLHYVNFGPLSAAFRIWLLVPL